MGGACLALLMHVVTWADVWEVTRIVWDVTLTFVALIVISSVLDAAGFFEWAALKMAHAARGDGRRVLPFLMAGGFIADTTSLPFVTSNLVNIVSADDFGIGFVRYLVHMFVPNLFSLAASMVVLYLFYRKDIPASYDPTVLPQPGTAVPHRGMFRWSWVILAALMIGYFLTELAGIPLSLVACTVAAVMVLMGTRWHVVRPWPIVREAPWSIVFFSIGMYVVVYGLRNAGLTQGLSYVLDGAANHSLWGATLTMGLVSTVLSCVMNNLPNVMIGALAIHASHTAGVVREALVYANVIGCDLGPKITPIGSLATLLWLHVLGKQGLTITWGRYIRTGVILTMPTLLATLAGLWLWMRIVG